MSDSPKIYHILPLDKLDSVLAEGSLYSENLLSGRNVLVGSNIGISEIKERRRKTQIPCCEGLFVGDCVPFYYCARSVMLYLIYRGNHHNLQYKGGQKEIVHLEFDVHEVYAWAKLNNYHAIITDRNAGTVFFEAWDRLDALKNLDWEAINAVVWHGCKDGKQAEFLVENAVSVSLIKRIGVMNSSVKNSVEGLLQKHGLEIPVEIRGDWYY
jgi:hypothetical protein